MSMPTIPDLPTATTADNTDLLLLRQPGSSLGTDKQVTVAKVRQLNLAGLSSLPTGNTPVASDLMLVERGGANYQVAFQHVGFIKGVKMWFYHNLANEVSPNGWAIFTAGDTLLAVKGGSTYTTGGAELGNWQIPDHTLTLAQIPPHTHDMLMGKESAGSSADNLPRRARDVSELNGKTITAGGGQPHNHGSNYRPLAAVGIIMVKL